MRVLALILSVVAACGGRQPATSAPLGSDDAGPSANGGPPSPDGGAPADAGVPDAGPANPPPLPPLPTLLAPAAGALYHGVFPVAETPQPDSDASPAALDGYEQAVGRRVAWVYFDHEWLPSRAFPVQTATWVRERGAVPFIRMMLRSQRGVLMIDPTFTLDRIVAGEFDGDLAAWADQARAFGSPLIVEYGTEVNGDWNVWSAPYNGGLDVGPAKFKRAYRHIVELMRGRGATNITWALHYNGQNWPGSDPRNHPAPYYPGDDVVDWVGISVYGSERSNDDRCPTFRSLVDGIVPELLAATTTKPLFIFEIGITGNNPACPAGPWVEAAFEDLLGGRWPDVRGFAWWQQRFVDDPAVGGITDYLVQNNPAVTAAFRAALASPQIVDRPMTR